MHTFDDNKIPDELLTPEILQLLASIHEHKGRQDLFLEAKTDELRTLLDAAMIQSTGASNRIEGIFTSDKRLKELVSHYCGWLIKTKINEAINYFRDEASGYL